MGYQRCKGTDCTKFATKKKLVNQHQKGLGIDLLTLCVPCARVRYTGFVGPVCSHTGCMTAPQGGAFGMFCKSHSLLECSFADCTTAPQGGAFGNFCTSHSPLECSFDGCTTSPKGGKHGSFCQSHSTYTEPITLVKETAESVEELTSRAISKIDEGKHVYAGLMGTSGLGEIDRDTNEIMEANSTLEKESHLAIYVDGNDKLSAHDVARDAERVLIRSIGVDRLLNKRNGGQGRPPHDKSVGGIFIIVFKEQKKRKALADLSNK